MNCGCVCITRAEDCTCSLYLDILRVKGAIARNDIVSFNRIIECQYDAGAVLNLMTFNCSSFRCDCLRTIIAYNRTEFLRVILPRAKMLLNGYPGCRLLPIKLAICRCNFTAVKMLIEHGACVNSHSRFQVKRYISSTVLMAICCLDHMKYFVTC